jgi:hypothetical protein
MGADTAQRWVSVPQLAGEWSCSTDQVLRLIHGGQLQAINVALRTSGRARYLIDRAEVQAFVRRRTTRPTVRGRGRRQQRAGVIEFF